ncbi:MAG: hypothetical protein FWF46_03170 [Oscillospiraceae bacterium]|nr:hypothetical protein [Oscillospiraceae bacterium]
MSKTIKIIIGVLIIAIIIAGIVMDRVKGFNYGINYSTTTEMKVYLGQEVDMDGIKSICKNSFDNKQFTIRKLDYFNDSVSVYVRDITDDEINAFVNNVNSAYNAGMTKDYLAIIKHGPILMRQIIKPYIIPGIIAFALILVYMAIRYKNKGFVKSFLQPGLIIILAELLYFSIVSLARIPVNIYTIPIGLLIFLIAVTLVTVRLEKEVVDIYGKQRKK